MSFYSQYELEALFDRFDILSKKYLEYNRLVDTLDMLGVVNPETKLKNKMNQKGLNYNVSDLVDKATFLELCSSIAEDECFKNN